MSFFTNRRKMLMGLAATTTAAVTGSTATGHTAPQEAAELIALSDRLEATTAAYLDATAQVARIAAQWGPQWPTPAQEAFSFGHGSKRHESILGNGITTPFDGGKLEGVRNIGTPEMFEREAAKYRREYTRKMATKSQRGAWTDKLWMERSEAAIAPARDYWAEVERIKAASGIEQAQERVTATREDLRALVRQIVTFEERTVTGLIIKAQALQAWGHVDTASRIVNLEATEWTDSMAATVIRQTGGAA